MLLAAWAVLSAAAGATDIPPGPVSGHWTAAGSPYLVQGEITIPIGQSLILDPGVQVVFQGHYKFLIRGFLEAVGNAADSIIFTAADPGSGWWGLRFLNAPDSSRLEYCILERGRAVGVYPDSNGYGGGLFCYRSNPVIRHCTFRQNYCEWYGAAACFWQQSNPTVEACLFSDNRSDDDGGALFCGSGSNPLIRDCTFANNWALAWGGGICSFWSDPIIANCTFHDNWADDGGALFYYETGGILERCTIYGNAANMAGGIFNHVGSSTLITHCTLYGNDASSNGGGIYWNASTATVENTIVAGNTGSGGMYFYNSPAAQVRYSDIASNLPQNFAGGVPAGLGVPVTVNLNGDPCDLYFNLLLVPDFFDPLLGDFRLQVGSPCRDAGDPASPPDPDSSIADQGAVYTPPYLTGTYVPGGNVSGHWSADASPYLVGGDLTIPAGQLLSISPGVDVIFLGAYFLEVHGLLQAMGTAADSIIFTAADTVTGWQGLHFLDAPGGSALWYCRLQYGKAWGTAPNEASCGGAVYCENAAPSLIHCLFQGNVAALNGGALACSDGSPTVQFCTFSGNSAGQYGGAIHAAYSNIVIQECLVTGNEAVAGGGGIHITGDSSPNISHCTVEYNSADLGGGVYLHWCQGTVNYTTISSNSAWKGAGLACDYAGAGLNLHHCTIRDNAAQQHGGGIWSRHYVSGLHGTLRQSTVVDNAAVAGGGVYCDAYSGLTLHSNIIANNSGGGLYRTLPAGGTISYNDFYGNGGGAFAGSGIPANLGLLVTFNANRDSCDAYFNLLADPRFVNAALDDFQLLPDSPCIDAGNPAAMYNDPDGTVADMGAWFYNQSPLRLTLAPLNPPVLIPAGGGSFSCNVLVENLSTGPVQFDFWTMVTLPSGSLLGPLFNYTDRTIAANASLTRNFTQSVGAGVGAGLYLYRGYVGQYPSVIWAQDQFEILKLPAGNGDYTAASADGWGICWEQPGERSQTAAVPSSDALTVSPNPFNPVTSVSFEQRAASNVRLRVYDTAGREITTLVNGWKNAGSHEVTFDGAGLPSGVYLLRMEAGSFTQAQKLVLLK